MKKYLLVLFIFMFVFVAGFALAAQNFCCLKTACQCMQGECCQKGKSTCKCACSTGNTCSCKDCKSGGKCKCTNR